MDDYSGNIDQQLINAYRDTNYKVFKPALNLKIGHKNDDLDTFLIDNNAFSWAFITSCNPHSEQLTDKENKVLYLQLKKDLQGKGLRFCEGEGRGEDSDWPAEKSFFILHIKKSESLTLARKYKQNAFVYGQVNAEAQLIFC